MSPSPAGKPGVNWELSLVSSVTIGPLAAVAGAISGPHDAAEPVVLLDCRRCTPGARLLGIRLLLVCSGACSGIDAGVGRATSTAERHPVGRHEAGRVGQGADEIHD